MPGLPDFLYSVWTEAAAAVFLAAALAVWGRMTARWPAPQAVFYGLVTFAILLTVFDRIWPQPDAQTQIEQWLERGGYSVRRELGRERVFYFEVTEQGGKKILVYQPSYEGAPIVIEGRLDVTQNVRNAIEVLGPKGKYEFLIGLQLSMMQYGIGFDGIGDPLNVVVFQDMFTYEGAMPEYEFIRRVLL